MCDYLCVTELCLRWLCCAHIEYVYRTDVMTRRTEINKILLQQRKLLELAKNKRIKLQLRIKRLKKKKKLITYVFAIWGPHLDLYTEVAFLDETDCSQCYVYHEIRQFDISITVATVQKNFANFCNRGFAPTANGLRNI